MPADRPATEPQAMREMTPDELLAAFEQVAHYPRMAIERERAAQGAAPRAEGLDVERLTRILTAIHGDNVPFPRGVPTSPREYAEQIVAMDARLSRPSDERVPESEEPR